VLAVAANGTFNCIRHGVPHMINAGGGTIIVTGDLVNDPIFPEMPRTERPRQPTPCSPATPPRSCAAEELRPFGINVNAVNPGATATPMILS
jgi:NAD(P)-dependent dehydrogenase (short-subunit alcohol dehydrogenase family)